MKKLITMCLLIIGLVVTGCGSSSGGNGSLNTPVIYNVTPTNSSSIANFVDSEGNITVTLTGVNFGSKEHGEVWFAGYDSESSSTPKEVPFRLSLNYGGSWSDNTICLKIVKSTIDVFPYGAFFVVANGQQSPYSLRCSFGGGDLKNAIVSSVSPSIINSYDNNSRNITITGSGFGNNYNNDKSLVLFDMSSTSNTWSVKPVVWNDQCIVFTVPAGILTNTSTIGIKDSEYGSLLGNSLVSQFKYVVNDPYINSVYPTMCSVGEEVTIFSQNGGFGDTKPTNNYSFTLNGCPITNIVAWSDSFIRFIVPDGNYVAGQATINLSIYNKNLTNNSLSVGPYITNIVNNSGSFITTYYYTINGYGFNNKSSLVIPGNTSEINIVSYNATSIYFSSSSNLSGKTLQISSGGLLVSPPYVIP